jgi:hypothetical protein
MIFRDTAALDKFLAKVKDASRLGLKEVRLDTRDAVDISALLAQMLLDLRRPRIEEKPPQDIPSTSLDGGKFK